MRNTAEAFLLGSQLKEEAKEAIAYRVYQYRVKKLPHGERRLWTVREATLLQWWEHYARTFPHLSFANPAERASFIRSLLIIMERLHRKAVLAELAKRPSDFLPPEEEPPTENISDRQKQFPF